MNKLLLIDIGGTNMRYATAYSDSDEISSINKKAFNEATFYENLEELKKEHNIDILIYNNLECYMEISILVKLLFEK